MSNTVVTNLMRELVEAHPTAAKLPVDSAREFRAVLQRYDSIEREDALTFLELFTTPGQWLIVDLFRGRQAAGQTVDRYGLSDQVVANHLPASLFSAELEVLSPGRVALAGAYLALQEKDLPATAMYLVQIADAAETVHTAKTFDEIQAVEREQHELCREALAICDGASALVNRPSFAITQGAREALTDMQVVRNRIVPLMSVLSQNVFNMPARSIVH